MDGLLIVDKPSGPTSHDVVASIRRVLHERRIGHTGTLDPMASGVLPLVVGRATRLARFLTGDKAYDATIRLGVDTDTCDAQGRPLGNPFTGPWPERPAIDAALARFRGTFVQQPPAFSAKKIAGQRSYALARRAGRAAADAPATLAMRTEDDAGVTPLPVPVPVTAHRIELTDTDQDLVRVHVACAAGFYVRSLASDLGVALGTGAHLVALRRTEAAGFGLDSSIPFERLRGDHGAEAAAAALIPMERMLPDLPAVSLTDEGVSHVRFGRSIGPAEATRGFEEALSEVHGPSGVVARLFAPSGALVALASAGDHPGLLHPAIVLL